MDAKVLNEFIKIIDDRIDRKLSNFPAVIVKSAEIISSQTTTMTIRFAGDTSNIAGVRFVNGLSLTIGDKINILIYNNSSKSTSYLIIEKV